MRLLHLALAALAVLTLSACQPQASDPEFGAKVRAYLLDHPEVVEEAQIRLQEKRIAAAINQVRPILERDPRDFVANPAGRITVVEFFDYQCGHCINIAPAVLDIIKRNPDVRFVFKEMPIFGADSEAAARAAIAVKQAGGNGVGLYQAYMSTRPLTPEAITRIAVANGATAARLQDPSFQAAANAQILEVHSLAQALGITGTPAFIVGDTLIPGEDLEGLKAAIERARGRAG